MKRNIVIVIVFMLIIQSCILTQEGHGKVINNSDYEVINFSFSWVNSKTGLEYVTYDTIPAGGQAEFDCLLAEDEFAPGAGTYTSAVSFSYELDGTEYEYDSLYSNLNLSDGRTVNIVIANSDYVVTLE